MHTSRLVSQVTINSHATRTLPAVDGYVSVGTFIGGGTHVFRVDPY